MAQTPVRNLKRGTVRAGGLIHPITKEAIPITYHRGTHLFRAKYGACTFEGVTYVEVENALYRHVIPEAEGLTWEPVIVVTLSERHGIELFTGRARRIYITRLQDGSRLWVDWAQGTPTTLEGAHEVPQNMHGEFPAQTTNFHGESVLYLPYDEGLWTALEWARREIGRLQVGLARWISDPDLRARLGRAGVKVMALLCDPEDPEVPAADDVVVEALIRRTTWTA